MDLPRARLGATAYLGSRRPILLAAAAVALLVRLAGPSPAPRSEAGVATLLGDAVGGDVRPEDFIWEERRGFLAETWLGRRVLFLAAPRDGAGARDPADLYRAEVRLTRGGRALSVHRARNLSRTPLGDDRDLAARGRRVAYATFAYGAVQGVTVLDLAGDGAAREARTRWERLRADAESWLEAGTRAGLGRTEILFGKLPSEARFEIAQEALVLALGPEAEPAAHDFEDGAVRGGPSDPYGIQAHVVPHPVRPVAELLVGAVRRGLGEGAAARGHALVQWAEGRRARARSSGERRGEALTGAGNGAGWPPEPLIARGRGPVDEGVWRTSGSELLGSRLPAAAVPPAPSPGGWSPPSAPDPGDPAAPTAPSDLAAPPLVHTSIRYDPSRSHRHVRLVAVDSRQLDLRWQPGLFRPHPSVGPHGRGRIPESLAASDRVVAAFNGGPDSIDERRVPGMVHDRRVLAPPGPGWSTIAMDSLGAAWLGPWSAAPAAAAPEAWRSIRQGPPGSTDAVRAGQRSALCVTASGHLVYGWGEALEAGELEAPMKLAGCTTTVHLAASPAPVGFAILGRQPIRASEQPPADAGEPALRGDLLDEAMSFEPARLGTGAAHDFFYLVARDVQPAAPLSDGATWVALDGAQPSPAWIPAIHGATVQNLGAEVHLTSIAPGRTAFRVVAGTKEAKRKGVAPARTELSEGDRGRVVAAIGLSTGRRRSPRGLALDGIATLPARGEQGALVVDRAGRVTIAHSTRGMAADAGADLVELPLTAENGKLLPEAREVGSRRPRAAGCLLANGAFAVASTTFDSDEATTEALLEIGCTRVLALDRGAHQAAFVHRGGTGQPLEPRYESTVLYVLDEPMVGRAGVLSP